MRSSYWIASLAAALALVSSLAAEPAKPGQAVPEYGFEDNLKEALEAGDKDLAAGKLTDAEVDFENALALDPESAKALERLFDVYEKAGKKLLAEKLLGRIRGGGRLAQEKLAALEKRLDAIVASTPRAGPTAASPSAQTVKSAVAGSAPGPVASTTATGAAPAKDGLDDLEKELTGGLPPASAAPDSKSARAATGPSAATAPPKTAGPPPAAVASAVEPPKTVPAPSDKDLSKLSPEEKFSQSLELAKKKDYQRAIPLYVAALQANNGLLARDDFGLRALSQNYYESRSKTDPKNPQLFFMIGWFAELDSRNDDALKAYQEVAKLSRAGDDLHSFATLKVEQIQALQKQFALAQAQQEAKKRDEARQKELAEIAAGKGKGLQPADYLKKGAAAFDRWKKDKAASTMAEALAYYLGAVAVDGKNAKVRLAYAKVKIDQAIAGEAGAKDVARTQLETALTLNPDADTKKQIQSLLDGLGGGKPPKAK